MKTPLQLLAGISVVVLLAGCGAGSTVVEVAPPPPQFIAWAGSTDPIHVIDGLGHTFAFYADNGCLSNLQTGNENTSFCLIPGTSNMVAYGAFRGEVVDVVASNGSCQAAMIDQLTGNFVDIEVDAYGREVVSTTQLRPVACGY